MANYSKAIAAYETLLVSRNAPFDKYVAGDKNAISGAAKRGLGLFIGKAACIDCHSGPFFTDQKFHNLGVPQEGVNVPREDLGRFTDLNRLITHPLNSKSKYADGPGRVDIEGLMTKEEDKGLFRTPTLRGVHGTAPYFHTGAATTLSEVIWFYNDGGGASGYGGVKDPRMVPLGLDSQEIADLVAFLETLTGEPVAEELLTAPM
jgi:cytochrome c peroxidase